MNSSYDANSSAQLVLTRYSQLLWAALEPTCLRVSNTLLVPEDAVLYPPAADD